MIRPPSLSYEYANQYPGEIKIDKLEKRQIPENHKEVLYAIHPSTIDGDGKGVVKEKIQEILDSQNDDSRVVIVAPPQGYVYLNEGTKATDIRSDQYEREWVSISDINEQVKKIVIVGGNLELCLSATLESLMWKFRDPQFIKDAEYVPDSLEIELPLESIYTKNSMTAQALFNQFRQSGFSEAEAAVALLTTSNPRTGVGMFAYGDFEIISSNGKGRYRVCVNGALLVELNEKPVEVIEAKKQEVKEDRVVRLDDHFELEWEDIEIPEIEEVVYTINLIFKENSQDSEVLDTTSDYSFKLEHTRRVLEKYDINY